MKLLFVTNQGGDPVVDLTCAIATEWQVLQAGGDVVLAVWWEHERQRVLARTSTVAQVYAYEEFLKRAPGDWREHVRRLNDDYPDVTWGSVIASERAFTDTSFLIGAGGNRHESHEYVQRILVNMVRFFESICTGVDAIVCQTADSLFTHVLYKVAARRGVRILAIKPAWLAEKGKSGFTLSSDEYTHSPAMIAAYESLRRRQLTDAELARAESFRKDILGFDVKRAVETAASRKYTVGPMSPNLSRLPTYLLENFRRNKEVDYQRFDILAKVKANVLRSWRRWSTAKLVGDGGAVPPGPYVLFAFHFQPEQSTLVGGIFYANQIAAAENILKSLPLGWSLVIKEHPKGRGSRPAWQYRHLRSFPNLIFSDLPTRELMARADAVITITGTIAIEALAMDRPAVLLGRTYFDYADVIYRPSGAEELARIFRRILVEREYENWDDRHDLARKFFLSYTMGYRTGLPSLLSSARAVAEEIVKAMAGIDADQGFSEAVPVIDRAARG